MGTGVYITTEEQQYYIHLHDVPINKANPDDEGLYSITIVKKEDEQVIYDPDKKILFDGDRKITHVGVFVPDIDDGIAAEHPDCLILNK